AVPMRREEAFPGRLRATLWCRLDTVGPEDRFDRVTADVVADVLEAAADSRVPTRVGFSVAIHTTSTPMSGWVLGRPRGGAFEPSYFWAPSRRYHRKIVSGVTIPAMDATRRRPTTWLFHGQAAAPIVGEPQRREPCAARRTQFCSRR